MTNCFFTASLFVLLAAVMQFMMVILVCRRKKSCCHSSLGHAERLFSHQETKQSSSRTRCCPCPVCFVHFQKNSFQATATTKKVHLSQISFHSGPFNATGSMKGPLGKADLFLSFPVLSSTFCPPCAD